MSKSHLISSREETFRQFTQTIPFLFGIVTQGAGAESSSPQAGI